MQGWVPRSELSTEDIVHPETLFYQSQVVRCRVLSCRPEEEKLTLSLIVKITFFYYYYYFVQIFLKHNCYHESHISW